MRKGKVPGCILRFLITTKVGVITAKTQAYSTKKTNRNWDLL
jgi:hypothetical protein